MGDDGMASNSGSAPPLVLKNGKNVRQANGRLFLASPPPKLGKRGHMAPQRAQLPHQRAALAFQQASNTVKSAGQQPKKPNLGASRSPCAVLNLISIHERSRTSRQAGARHAGDGEE